MPNDDDDDQYRESCTSTEEKFEEMAESINSNFSEMIISIAQNIVYLFGASLAMVISYSNNGSILWAIVHGLLSWGYVIYYAILK
jgi:hypothetical protein